MTINDMEKLHYFLSLLCDTLFEYFENISHMHLFLNHNIKIDVYDQVSHKAILFFNPDVAFHNDRVKFEKQLNTLLNVDWFDFLKFVQEKISNENAKLLEVSQSYEKNNLKIEKLNLDMQQNIFLCNKEYETGNYTGTDYTALNRIIEGNIALVYEKNKDLEKDCLKIKSLIFDFQFLYNFLLSNRIELKCQLSYPRKKKNYECKLLVEFL